MRPRSAAVPRADKGRCRWGGGLFAGPVMRLRPPPRVPQPVTPIAMTIRRIRPPDRSSRSTAHHAHFCPATIGGPIVLRSRPWPCRRFGCAAGRRRRPPRRPSLGSLSTGSRRRAIGTSMTSMSFDGQAQSHGPGHDHQPGGQHPLHRSASARTATNVQYRLNIDNNGDTIQDVVLRHHLRRSSSCRRPALHGEALHGRRCRERQRRWAGRGRSGFTKTGRSMSARGRVGVRPRRPALRSLLLRPDCVPRSASA